MPRLEEIYWRAECSFAESYKHGVLADALGVSWAESVGIVASLFGQVRRQIADGDISKVTDAVLRRWCHSRKVTLAALKAAGWVDEDGHVHGWGDRYSVIVEKREAERDRKRAQRGGTSGTLSRDCPTNVPPVPPVRAFAREGEGEGYTKEGEMMTDGGLASAAPPPPAPKTSRKKRVGLPESGAIRELADWWNAIASELSLAAVESIDAKREASARDRIAEGLWERRDELANALRGSAHHRGSNADGWVAGFDWLVGRGHWIALIERSKVVANRPAPAPAKRLGERLLEGLDLSVCDKPAGGAP